MRTSTSVSVVALSLAAVIGGSLAVGSAAGASAAPARPGDRSATVLQVIAETQQFAVIDVGSKGPALGLGDQVVSSDRLTQFGKPAGRGGTVMTVVGTTPNTLTTQFVTTLDLVDGQLVLQGIGDGPTGPPTEPIAFSLAVTGGTGSYQKARGFAHIVDRPGGTELITVHFADHKG